MGEHRSLLEKELECDFFEIDAFEVGHGYSTLRQKLEEPAKEFNVVMTSLGPKLSAVALYRLARAHPEVALAYAPSKYYNIDYSHGLGEGINGYIDDIVQS